METRENFEIGKPNLPQVLQFVFLTQFGLVKNIFFRKKLFVASGGIGWDLLKAARLKAPSFIPPSLEVEKSQPAFTRWVTVCIFFLKFSLTYNENLANGKTFLSHFSTLASLHGILMDFCHNFLKFPAKRCV